MSTARPEAPSDAAAPATRSISRVRVRYAETDQMSVVYHANYFVWFEVGRTDLLRHAGWSYRELEREGVSLPVIEAHCEYRQPARYDDELEIRTLGRLMSPVRIEFTYELIRVSDGVGLATGLYGPRGTRPRRPAVPSAVSGPRHLRRAGRRLSLTSDL